MSEASPSMKLVKGAPKAPPAATKAAAKKAPAAKKAAAPKTETVADTAVAETTATVGKIESTEVEATDLIVQVAHQVANMSQSKALTELLRLQNNIDQNFFTLGGVLCTIQDQSWWMEKGYLSMRDFVVAECAVDYRKSMYLIGIYKGLVESGVKWEDVGHLGWTKLKELAKLLTVDNVKEMVSQAEQMTVLQLIAHVKELAKASSGDASDAAPTQASSVTSMTFKLHADQKATIREAIDKVKETMNTTVDSVALEHMALDYLSGDGKAVAKQMTLAQMMQGKSAEDVLGIFTECFPDVEIEAKM